MAALKVNPDNSITLPFPLLAILLTFSIAVAGWGASLVGRVNTLTTNDAKHTEWEAAHTKQAADNLADIKASIKQTNDLVTATAAASTKQNADLQETLTTVRIQMASRR